MEALAVFVRAVGNRLAKIFFWFWKRGYVAGAGAKKKMITK